MPHMGAIRDWNHCCLSRRVLRWLDSGRFPGLLFGSVSTAPGEPALGTLVRDQVARPDKLFHLG